jgi:hypothetical protein
MVKQQLQAQADGIGIAPRKKQMEENPGLWFSAKETYQEKQRRKPEIRC